MLTKMRLDIFLKLSRLVLRRRLAQQMCEAGAVKVNGSAAKSAREVKAGDLIAIRQRGRITTARVLEIPARPLSKAQAVALYEIVSVESYEDD